MIISGSSFLCHLTVCPLKEHPAAKVALILLNFDNPAERSKKCSGTDRQTTEVTAVKCTVTIDRSILRFPVSLLKVNFSRFN